MRILPHTDFDITKLSTVEVIAILDGLLMDLNSYGRVNRQSRNRLAQILEDLSKNKDLVVSVKAASLIKAISGLNESKSPAQARQVRPLLGES